jgi:hypothetical protein
MTGYALHPEARVDLEEIWEFIRADNPDAADRMICGNSVRHSRHDSLSRPRPSTARAYLTAFTFHSGT